MSPDDEYLPPPPSYEISQVELDTKITIAEQASAPSSVLIIRSADGRDEEWEPYDVEAFDAAARRYEQLFTNDGVGQSSVRPLHIKKKSEGSTYTKERPSWYKEAGLAQSSTTGSSANRDLPSSASSSSRRHDLAVANATPPSSRGGAGPGLEDADEDRTEPPPPFTALGPSFDGPPYATDSSRPLPTPLPAPPPSRVPPGGAYHGNGSAPPSPLASPQLSVAEPGMRPLDFRPSPSPQPLANSSVQMHSHQSLPPPPRKPPAPTRGPRLNTSYTPKTTLATAAVSLMEFDYKTAYTVSPPQSTQPAQQQPSIDATAFYNSAVSAHLNPNAIKTIPQSTWQTTDQHEQPQPNYYAQQQSAYPPSDPVAPQSQMLYSSYTYPAASYPAAPSMQTQYSAYTPQPSNIPYSQPYAPQHSNMSYSQPYVPQHSNTSYPQSYATQPDPRFNNPNMQGGWY